MHSVPRIVIDTNVLWRGLRHMVDPEHGYGAAFRVVLAVFELRAIPLASVALFLEYDAVLHRAEFLERSGLSAIEVDQLLTDIVDLVEPVTPIWFRCRGVLADANDEHVLECAVNGHADMLVTDNERDFRRAESFGVKVVTAREFVQTIGSERGEP